MIVLFNEYGNHSNRLFQNLHFEAFCYSNNIEYYNSTFLDLQHLYSTPVKTKFRNISKILKTKPIRAFRKMGFMNNIISFNEEKTDNLKILNKCARRNNIIFVDGWGFRDYDATTKYRSIFQIKYKLREEYITDNDTLKIINDMKLAGKIVIGIHIRRGDYAEFKNGEYYYSDDMYMSIINKIQKNIHKELNKESCFIIFSNEKVQLKNCIISNNDWYIDHYLMMNCNYLIGPPSTFTLWASYLGEVPYIHIKKDTDLSINCFSICNG